MDSTTATRGHEVKCWTTFFPMVLDGSKPFEVRKNDRHYQVGDTLHLREWSPSSETYTGRHCYRTISYILAGGQFGIEEGYVVLGLS